jgi:hypothetical protein
MNGPLTLPEPSAVAALAEEDLPALLVHLAALQAAVAARLANAKRDKLAPSPQNPIEPDRRVRADEAVAIIGCSVRWLRQHGQSLPSYRRDLNGRRVTWLRSALIAWMEGRGS